jgi:hypothetical protein
MNWTADQEDRVRELWLAGYTGEQIAGLMNMSRDRVLSKVRRLGLVRALRFVDEVATFGSVERAALAVGYSVEQGRRAWARIVERVGWQAG